MTEDTKRIRAIIWRLWKEGFFSLVRVFVVANMFWILWPKSLTSLMTGEMFPWYVTVPIDIGIVAALLLVVPLWIGLYFNFPDRAALQRRELSPLIDELAKQIGLDWRQHWISELDTLVHERKTREAAREYRQRFGVSWDKAHAAVRDWQLNEHERKLRAILEYVQNEKDADSMAARQTAR